MRVWRVLNLASDSFFADKPIRQRFRDHSFAFNGFNCCYVSRNTEMGRMYAHFFRVVEQIVRLMAVKEVLHR